MLLIDNVKSKGPLQQGASKIFMSTKSQDIILGDTRDKINNMMKESLSSAFPNIPSTVRPAVTPAGPKQEQADYQTNIAMILSKELKMKPVEVANALQQELLKKNEGTVSSIQISGPGFLNFVLSDEYLKQRIITMLGSERLGLPTLSEEQKKRVVIDFSSPNIAKEMHVGHLRSTIIGDTISRVLEFIGYDVLRLNHVGDWGTQFGMLIHYMKTRYPDAIQQYLNSAGKSISIAAIEDLVVFYKAAKKAFDENENGFQDASRLEVVKLQSGDKENVLLWQAICEQSRKEFQNIYNLLNITLNERGESFYNPYLEDVVEYLKSTGVAVESQGATCVFVPGYTNVDGTPLPLIVKKSDGGFLYATTDLAALKHRLEVEKANRIIYITDAGQAQHFAMVFDAAKAANMIPTNAELVHVPFGVIQGEDGKKFKSRSGDTVKLKDLLLEAVRLTEEDMLNRKKASELKDSAAEANTDDISLAPEELVAARTIGLAAVKYADLSMNRESNYRFSYKKMLSLTGNTAPYMMYAYVRIRGIQRKALESISNKDDSNTAFVANVDPNDIAFTMPEEIALAKHLNRWDEVVLEVAKELYPNKMCEYLFEVSQKFNQFYEKCPVLKAETKTEQISRAVLCSVTADVLRVSLGLLGISVVEKL